MDHIPVAGPLMRAARRTAEPTANTRKVAPKRTQRITQVTSSSTTTWDLTGSGLVVRSPGTGVRHVSGGRVCLRMGARHGATGPSVDLGVRLTTRGRLICLEAAIRHDAIVGSERPTL